MSFDPRSLERLRQLGRNLPQPLPPPEAATRPGKPEPPRHRLETEQDPEQLFRELMQASSDGSVPPHLLDRLRQLEARRQPAAPPASTPAASPAPGSTGPERRRQPSLQAGSGVDSDLYSAFRELLDVESDAQADLQAQPRQQRPGDERLGPRPALRPPV